jgi:hypothetical protein
VATTKATPLKIKKEAGVLYMHQILHTPFGVAQIQVAVNQAKVRAALHKIAPDAFSGEGTAKAKELTAVACLKGGLEMAKACGLAPMKSLAKTVVTTAVVAQGEKYKKAGVIVKAYEKDQLKACGGFPGLEAKMAAARKAEGRKMLERGIPPKLVAVKLAKMRDEDEEVLKLAAEEVGVEYHEDESSGDDGSGRWRKRRAAPGAKNKNAAAQEDEEEAEPEEKKPDAAGDVEMNSPDDDNPPNNEPVSVTPGYQDIGPSTPNVQH